MRQKSLNDNSKAREQPKGEMMSDIDDVDKLLDDEGWDILNSLTEDELALLNSDFDPENMLIPTGERINHERHIPAAKQVEKKEFKPEFSQKDLVKTMDSMKGRHQRGERQEAPAINSTLQSVEKKTDGETMFNQKDLVASLNKMVEQSKPIIQNEKIRQKEEERQRKRDEEFARKRKEQLEKEEFEENIVLSPEEEELLADATEEELIEAAALLNMNDILTSDQINAVYAGDKPKGTMKSSVKSTVPKQARITKSDVETELDVVALNKNLKSDSDALFYLCVNNQPLLERETLDLIISCVKTSKKIKHLSLSMLGLTDKRAIALADALTFNTQLETLNLDSNIIGMPGIEALMEVVSTHPSLREIKVSNQKQPFGGQGEECMAAAVGKNQNILKFGYSFRQAAPRNKVDRAIIRNNEIMRQKRKNGEEVYDLKAVCKIRDPWPQPWIKIKGQRQLGSQLEAKVTDMGLMIDVEDAGRESRGPKVREEREAKPLDIAALLAARASKLKNTNVGNLEKETEERRKKTLLAMKQSEEESGRVGTMLKKGDVKGESPQPSEAKESLILGNNETVPPVENDELKKQGVEIDRVEEKKEEEGKEGITKKEEDSKHAVPLVVEKSALETKSEKNEMPREPEKKDWQKGGSIKEDSKPAVPPVVEKSALETKSEKNETPKEPEKKDWRKGGIKVAQLDDSSSKVTPLRRRKKADDDEPESLFDKNDSKKAEEEQKRKEVDQKKVEEEKKAAEEQKRKEEEKKKKSEEEEKRKKIKEEETKKAEQEKRKAEEEKRKAKEEKTKAEEEKRKAEEEKRKAEKEKRKAEEEKRKAEEEKKKAEEEKRKAEEEKKKAEEERKRIEEEEETKKEKLGAGKKIAALAPVDSSAPVVRRRKPRTFDDEPAPDFLAASTEEPKKEEPKKEEEKAEVEEKPLSAAEERAKSLKERREALAARKAAAANKTATETAVSTKPSTEAPTSTTADETKVSERPLSPAEERAKSLRERREALAAKKAARKTSSASPPPIQEGRVSSASPTSSEGEKSPAAERAKSLRERREALAAKKAARKTSSASPPPAQDGNSSSPSPPPGESERARQLRERREKLEQKRSTLRSPTTETSAAATEKPKVNVAASLGGQDEAKPLTLKERRALLAEKKRLMGK